jgi:chemotaxis protein methyltransferase CheR
MQLSPQTLAQLTQLIRQWTGLALGPEKSYLLRHRLAPIVRSCGLESFDDLLLRLQAGRGATKLQEAVVEAITTKETSFFRDDWLFEALRGELLPDVARQSIQANGSRRRIRIWSAGTSTGQEAYSLAMVVHEFLDAAPHGLRASDVSILATDISGEAIDIARTGLYSQSEVAKGLSEARLRRFFTRHGAAWMAQESLRTILQFRTCNLLRPALEGAPLDLVLCRNVLIYFDEPTRVGVCRGLRDVLRPGGWLALGSAESLYGMGAGWEPVKFGRAFVYRKTP